MPFCTKEQVSQHSEARMCSAKESDVSFFGNIKFKLNKYSFFCDKILGIFFLTHVFFDSFCNSSVNACPYIEASVLN